MTRYRYITPLIPVYDLEKETETLQGEGWEIFGLSPIMVASPKGSVLALCVSARIPDTYDPTAYELRIREMSESARRSLKSSIILPDNVVEFPRR